MEDEQPLLEPTAECKFFWTACKYSSDGFLAGDGALYFFLACFFPACFFLAWPAFAAFVALATGAFFAFLA